MSLHNSPAPAGRPLRVVYTVSQLNRQARQLLEGGLPLLWVEGEVSNLARPSSGHIYFSLKDGAAQVRCAMFRTRGGRLDFVPRDGAHVLLRARVSLYEPRGDFQLIVEHMEEAGDGALRRAFEALKQRLLAEGLFDSERKRPLPAYPSQLGVITSPTGAAIRDILTVLRQRFPSLPVLVYPVPVQGQGAAQKIAAAIELAGRRAECDVLILARGGGSLEDLWAFNEEAVARAVHACPIPIVSGVGHEIDFTIADFAADQRAPTPSAAAALVTPDGPALYRSLDAYAQRLARCLRSGLDTRRQAVAAWERRLAQQHPGRRLRAQAQRVDELEQRLNRALQARLHRARARTDHAHARLLRHSPLPRLQAGRQALAALRHRLAAAMHTGLQLRRGRLTAAARTLDGVSPLATLSRGYAILRTADSGAVVRRAADAPTGTRLQARLAAGRLICDVVESHDENQDDPHDRPAPA